MRTLAILLMGYALFAANVEAQNAKSGELAPLSAETKAEPKRAVLAKRVSPSTWYVEGLTVLGTSANRNFISNAGFIVADGGVVVVDALGSPALARELIAEIRRVTDKPITHVVVTHYHADHVYGLQEFKRIGARIVAHSAAREYLSSDTAALRLQSSRVDLKPWIDDSTKLQAADLWIDGTRDLIVGATRIVIKAVGPSHTPEDLAVFLPSEKVLFAGDLVFRRRIPFVGQANSGHWIKALDQLLALDATAIVPGHGPLSTDARVDMQLTRDYLAYLRATMGKAAKNLDPFEEAYNATDWSLYEQLPLFKLANRMNAYNTYLLMEREAD